MVVCGQAPSLETPQSVLARSIRGMMWYTYQERGTTLPSRHHICRPAAYEASWDNVLLSHKGHSEECVELRDAEGDTEHLKP